MKRLLLIMFLAMFPVLAHGATYYVAKTGSDSNSCPNAQSQSTPKLTINAGISCLQAGDTLVVKAGTYAETVDSQNSNGIPSGTAGNPTIVKSESKYGAVIRPDASTPAASGPSILVFNQKAYITIDGFVIDGINTYNYDSVLLYGNSNLTFQNNDIKNGTGDACTISGGTLFVVGRDADNIRVTNNKIHDITYVANGCNHDTAYCMYLLGNNDIIENNEMYNCGGHGIHGYNAYPNYSADNNIIRNNYMHNIGTRGILITGGENTKVYNNIVSRAGIGNEGIGPGYQGINVGGYGNAINNAKVYNNTVVDGAGACISLKSGTGHEVRNNICYGNADNSVVDTSDGPTTKDHNLSGQDPLFVNAAAGDFHLRAGSPAIDAGINVGLPYNGSAPDLGALESGAGIPPPTNLRAVVY